MSNDLDVITKTYDLILWCLPQIIKFPKTHRFTIGEKLENLLFDILGNLIEAKYTKNKMEILARTNIQLEKFRYFVRICKDMKFINIDRYEYLSRQINDIGNLIGGWLRQQHHQKGIG
ncbi:MAG: hypothetical protein AUJ85_02785 [Elusimicrobia bacterium CG1_02_37_114]|nr:MAG: hypothetical protein AUJ85_02785 [Elusimicrobia bacterium CG1_02_37_114]PIV53569.1 MAG: four helix bundle protein [Elusimicrobia bacterium CG02_land_8_20_14_3_00_37_13]PIZ13733.1 MAG: four helix bundle protein [Elusimicrobia bacterium CG_4_10_14_0_8_um_filter_37_32]